MSNRARATNNVWVTSTTHLFRKDPTQITRIIRSQWTSLDFGRVANRSALKHILKCLEECRSGKRQECTRLSSMPTTKPCSDKCQIDFLAFSKQFPSYWLTSKWNGHNPVWVTGRAKQTHCHRNYAIFQR